MLCFAGITPHPPVLVPSIGKEETEKLAATQKALEQLERDLYTSKPQIILIISPHTGLYESSFCVNAHTKYNLDFTEFGDVTVKKEWLGSPDLGAKIAHESRNAKIDVQLISEPVLDHGASIPLYFLTKNLQEVKILPIGYSQLSATDHILFGEFIKNIIMDSPKRIAVVASGDLAHTDPGNSSKFDEALIKFIESNSLANLLELDSNKKDVNECGYRSILIALGILKNMNVKFSKLCYEKPFGVGYLTGSFSF